MGLRVRLVGFALTVADVENVTGTVTALFVPLCVNVMEPVVPEARLSVARETVIVDPAEKELADSAYHPEGLPRP